MCIGHSESREVIAESRTLWNQQVSDGLKRGESAVYDAAEDKMAKRKASHQNREGTFTESQGSYDSMCHGGNRLWADLYSHTRGSSSTNGDLSKF